METVVHNVGDLTELGRSAAETLVGHALEVNQQLVIQVVSREVPPEAGHAETGQEQLPEWCNVYAGLSDEQIATLEQAIARRVDLTRPT